MTFDIALIGHLAYLLVAISYAARNIVWLRLLAVPACIFGIVFGLFVKEEPIWVIVLWNSVFLGINLVQLALTSKLESSLGKNSDCLRLLDFLYPMTRAQISQLIALGHTRTIESEETLIREDEFSDRLYLLIDGSASIWKSGELLATCVAGSILGDISYLTRQKCTATVVVKKGVRLIEWKSPDLRAKLDKLPDTQAAFMKRLAKDISNKLLRRESEKLNFEKELQVG